MKLKSTADGLKAAPVNPYPVEDYKDGFYVANFYYLEFANNNPELPLVKQMPGNTVFEGVEVKMGRSLANPDWRPVPTKTDRYFSEIQMFYEPIDEVKEQVREEALKKDNEAELTPDVLDKIRQMGENVKASNPELESVKFNAEKYLSDLKLNDLVITHPSIKAPQLVYVSDIMEFYAAEKLKQQQQGLVSLESVEKYLELRILELERDPYLHSSNKAGRLREIKQLGTFIKTLKQ